MKHVLEKHKKSGEVGFRIELLIEDEDVLTMICTEETIIEDEYETIVFQLSKKDIENLIGSLHHFKKQMK